MEFRHSKLFRTPNSFYIYDGIKNDLVELSESDYLFFDNIISGGCPKSIPSSIQPLFNRLASEQEIVTTLRHPYTDYLGYFLNRKLAKITLQLTQQCNFRCKYCVYSEANNKNQRSHTDRRMSWETAIAAIDFLYKRSVDSPRVNIGFYGGEPLLEFSLISDLVAYSKQAFSGKNLSFSMTTNGSLLNNNILKFLSENNFNLMISLDGPEEINDLNRVFKNGKGTFNHVLKKLSKIKKAFPEYFNTIQISTVLDPRNDFSCINEIFIKTSVFEDMCIRANLVDYTFENKEISPSTRFISQYEYHLGLALCSLFIEMPKEAISPISSQIKLTLQNNYYKFCNSRVGLQKTDAPSGPCIPGQMRPMITVSGQIFPCERVSETSDVMNIGSIYDGFNIEKANCLLNVARISQEECKACWSFRFCNQCCRGADNGGNALSKETRLRNCESTQNQAFKTIKTFLLFHEAERYGISKDFELQ